MDGLVLRALHLCSGYGGFELGLRMAGVPCRTVLNIERDAHAAAVLVARMEDKALDRAPIWDDLTTFDGTAWRGRVDLITAGFPCQPFSAAGRKRGVSDDRWLWPEIARIIREVGPRYVFLENVRGVVRHGLGFVLGDLADLGFDAEWGLLSASEVGAPHKRERWWLLANARGEGGPEVPRSAPGDEGRDGAQHGHVADSDGEDVAHPSSVGPGPWAERRVEGPCRSCPGVADTDSARHERSGLRKHESGQFPPRPDDDTGWRHWREQGGPEPGIRRMPDGATGRMERRDPQLADRLHLLGNGLVPQAAAAAWQELHARLVDG